MAITSNVKTTVTLSGDFPLSSTHSAAANTASPGDIQIKDLTSGDNTITVPAGGGSTATAVMIIPPVGNGNAVKLKGAGGDTGILIHKKNPTLLGLDSVTSFIVNVAANTNGVRFIFT